MNSILAFQRAQRHSQANPKLTVFVYAEVENLDRADYVDGVSFGMCLSSDRHGLIAAFVEGKPAALPLLSPSLIPAVTQEKLPDVLCRYCFNMDHWVPLRLGAAPVEARHCNDCPMFVTKANWEQHVENEHGGVPPDNSESLVIFCSACPICSGLMEPDAPTCPCYFCDICKAYVPFNTFDAHRSGCREREECHPFSRLVGSKL